MLFVNSIYGHFGYFKWNDRIFRYFCMILEFIKIDRQKDFIYNEIMVKEFKIIRPVGMKPKPDKYEEKVAELLAVKLQSDIAFVLRGSSTTPDIFLLKTKKYWEIKNIKGDGRHTIENNIRQASKQSKNIVISLLKSSNLAASRIESKIRYVLKTTNVKVDHTLLVTKTGKVIDIK